MVSCVSCLLFYVRVSVSKSAVALTGPWAATTSTWWARIWWKRTDMSHLLQTKILLDYTIFQYCSSNFQQLTLEYNAGRWMHHALARRTGPQPHPKRVNLVELPWPCIICSIPGPESKPKTNKIAHKNHYSSRYIDHDKRCYFYSGEELVWYSLLKARL